MKGVLIFYINVNREDETEFINSAKFSEMIMEANKEVIAKIKLANFDVMCVPCCGEASRTEKIMFEG